MRVLLTDGEMSNLNMDFGQLLSAGCCEYNDVTDKDIKAGKKPWKNVRVHELSDYKTRRFDDKDLALRWSEEVQSADMIITWNGVRFDLPALNTRRAEWGLPAVAPKRHKDLMYTARFRLKLASASQDNVAKFYGVMEKFGVGKTPMEPRQWVRALGGDYKAYKYIITHCANDIKVLAALWYFMKDIAGEIK